MKIAITGHTSGLGKFLFENLSRYHQCQGFSRSNGFDLKRDSEKVIKLIKNCDLFINNSFAMGEQIHYLTGVNSIPQIVMGSIAARNPDINMPYYSRKKKEIEDYFLDYYTHTEEVSLYLQLTGKSYKDYQLVLDTIYFWLEHPTVNFIGFKTK